MQILSLHSAFPFLSQPSSSLFTKYSHHIDTTISLSNIFFSSKIPFTPPLLPFREKFPPGTWEHAVVSTYHDGHIQFGNYTMA